MRWHEIITEGRDAPLFHATSVNGAIGILTADKIFDKTTHSGHGIKDQGGVSLTRMRSASKHFGDVLFVLDQAKLAQTKRLLPVDYWGLNGEPELAGVGRRQHNYAEAEEFLVGPLAPLSKYLVAIEISRKLYFELAEGARSSDKGYFKLLLDHPLLLIDGKPKAAAI